MPAMLPKAGKNDNLPVHRPGEWCELPWEALKQIASRTEYPAQRKTDVEVDLIPDLWARLILFSNALYDPAHTLHPSAVAKFRGLLALFALRERKRVKLSAVKVDLSKCKENAFCLALKRSDTSEEREDRTRLFRSASWEEPRLIHVDSRTVALTSPMTLVCPAEGPHITGLGAIPWFSGATFEDPRSTLNPAERQLLRIWVEDVSTRLASWTEAVGWRYGHDRLIFELDQFAADLKDTDAGLNHRTLSLSDEARLQFGGSIYSILGNAIRAEPRTVESSDVLLQGTEVGATRMLVLFRQNDPDVQIQPEVTNFESILVFEDLSVLDVENMSWGSNPGRLGTESLPAGVEWLDPKRLFLERLTFISGTQQKASLSHVSGQAELASEKKLYPLVPLTPAATAALGGLDLTKAVVFEKLDKGIKVTLRLPLRGGRVVLVHRVYSPDVQAVMPEEDSPVIEIWPPFKRDGWNFYASFWWSNSTSALTARPFPDEGHPSREEAGSETIEVRQMAKCPVGFLLYRKGKNAAGHVLEEPIGAVLLRIPPLRVPNLGTFIAGVDFGTSSTNVILRNKTGSAPYERLELATGPLQVLAGAVPEGVVASSRYFLPIGPEKESDPPETAPFLSFLRQRKTASHNSEPLIDSHILFLNSFNTLELGKGQIETQLKWENSKTKVDAYLRQLCLQTAAEVIARGGTGLEWRYSLPTAFNRRRREQYSKQVWEPLVNFVKARTGLGGEPAMQLTESTAAARYFKEIAKAPVSSGVVFVDIGGGTSDISVWQNNFPKYQVSIKFAGRDLFLGPLFEAPSVRDRLLQASTQVLPDIFSSDRVKDIQATKKPLIFDAHMEALLRDAGRRLPAELSKADGRPLEVSAQIIRLGVAGLFYYLGLILKSLEESGKFDRNLGGVYLGGNGSQLLHWADDGSFNPAGGFADVLAECLVAGTGWSGTQAKTIRVKLSDHPKEEAAAGLVVDTQLSSDGTERWDDVVSGEPFVKAGVKLSETASLTREDMKHVSVAGLPQLERFCQTYVMASNAHDFQLHSDFLPKDLIETDIFRQVHQFVADQQAIPNSDEVELAPLFIRGLRDLLRELPQKARIS